MHTSPAPVLDPHADIVDLTAALVDIESVSGNEKALADAVDAALREHAGHLEVIRDGDTVIARTDRGLGRRVLLAGHLDTVPVADNLPSSRRTREGREELVGRGSCDMKGGVAVFLKLAVEADAAPVDLTWIFYDHEEVAAADNSLTRLAAEHPDQLAADFAILGEPTSAGIEGGCKGTMKLEVTARGIAAHSARDWVGDNAIHQLAPVLDRLAGYEARRAVIDGLEYRECLNVVSISGGIAGNVIPDRATALLNYRFAPDTSPEQAETHVREVLDGLDLDIVVTDSAAGALPGLSAPAARDFLAALGDVPVAAKQGWTDVARFSALGTPA
ncbi:MAG: succinyl-diaminopimelate desuccinylase, partial [Brachybacterium alimentarium]